MTPKFEPSASQQALVPEKWIGPVPSVANPTTLSKWWETWGDTELLSLIEAAQASNTDIRTAKANLDYALAQLTVADSAFFPTIGGNSDGGRSHRFGSGSNSFGIGLTEIGPSMPAGLMRQLWLPELTMFPVFPLWEMFRLLLLHKWQPLISTSNFLRS